MDNLFLDHGSLVLDLIENEDLPLLIGGHDNQQPETWIFEEVETDEISG